MAEGTIRRLRSLKRGLSVLVVGKFLALAIATSSVGTPAYAERRVALVVGNAVYEAVPTLRNPVNDAGALAASLRRLGFEVKLEHDLGREALRDALAAFVDFAQGADWALIYFSGHGIEINGDNYIIPTDARLERDTRVRFEAVALDDALAAVTPARTLGMVILDACRDNPFRDKIARSNPTRSIGRGLARIEPHAGIFVAFAARDGQVALDGQGDHSPYTRALLKFIEEPGLEIDLLFRQVRAAVLEETGSQEPWTYGSIPPKRLYFAGPDQDPKIEGFLAASKVAGLLESPEAINRLIQTEAALTAANRQRALENPQLRDGYEKAVQVANEARRIVLASEERLSRIVAALTTAGNPTAFFSATAELSQFELKWAGFRAKNPKLDYLSDFAMPLATASADELAALKQQAAEKEREVDRLRSEAEARTKKLGSEISDLKQKADSLVQQRDSLATKLGTSEGDRQSLRVEIERLNTRISDYVRQVEALGRDRTAIRATLVQKESELAALQEKADSLEGQLHCTYAKSEETRIIGWSAYGTAYGEVGTARWSNESLNFEIAEGGERLARPKPGDIIKARRPVHIRRCFPDVPYDIPATRFLTDQELPPRVSAEEDYIAKPNELYRVRYVTQTGGGRYWVALERPPKGFFVQIGAYASEDAAFLAFRSLRSRFPILLAGKHPDIERVGPPTSETIVYRTRLAPPAADYDGALQLCSALREAKDILGSVDCFVTLN